MEQDSSELKIIDSKTLFEIFLLSLILMKQLQMISIRLEIGALPRGPKILARFDFRFLKLGIGVKAVGGNPDRVFFFGGVGTDSSGFWSEG